MCIGVPGQIHAIDGNQARVEVCGILRDVDLTLVGSTDETGASRLGQWVLVHVGFAMSIINEAESARHAGCPSEYVRRGAGRRGIAVRRGAVNHALR